MMLFLVIPSTAPSVLNVEVGTTTSSERFRGGRFRSALEEEEDVDPAGVADVLVNSSKDGNFRATLSVTTVFVDRLVSEPRNKLFVSLLDSFSLANCSFSSCSSVRSVF